MADCSDSRFAHHHRYSSSKQHCVVKPGAPVLHEMEAEVSLIGLIATEANSSILLATIAMDCSTRLRFEAERSLFHQSTGIDPWYYFHHWHDHGGKSTKYVHYKVYIRRGPAVIIKWVTGYKPLCILPYYATLVGAFGHDIAFSEIAASSFAGTIFMPNN